MSDETELSEDALEFKIGVYRVLVGDTPELQLERHNARGAAVVAEFKVADDVRVLDWGDTRDAEPHELVELLVSLIGSPAVQAAATSVVTWIGLKLADKAVDATVTAGFKALARRILHMQKSESRVNDAWITGPEGSPTLTLYPPEWGPDGRMVAAIEFSDGSRVEFHPPPGGWTGDPELEPAANRLPS